PLGEGLSAIAAEPGSLARLVALRRYRPGVHLGARLRDGNGAAGALVFAVCAIFRVGRKTSRLGAGVDYGRWHSPRAAILIERGCVDVDRYGGCRHAGDAAEPDVDCR